MSRTTWMMGGALMASLVLGCSDRGERGGNVETGANGGMTTDTSAMTPTTAAPMDTMGGAMRMDTSRGMAGDTMGGAMRSDTARGMRSDTSRGVSRDSAAGRGTTPRSGGTSTAPR